MKVDWKQKLTSRKFWALVIGFVTPLLLAFGVSEEITMQITAIIMSGAAVVAYIFGEALIDAKREGDEQDADSTEVHDEE